MPIVGEKKPLTSWESWQKHMNKKFGIEEEEAKEETQESALLEESQNSEGLQDEEIISLEFLEKPVE